MVDCAVCKLGDPRGDEFEFGGEGSCPAGTCDGGEELKAISLIN